jgi:GTP cyclohydrolase II
MTMLASATDTTDERRVTLASVAELPTKFGDFRIHVFIDTQGREHVALVRGDVKKRASVPMRMHSECLTGDAFASLRCDCREQLERAMETIGAMPFGIVLYLRQEGRGIGLANKIRAYELQQKRGMDTVEANLALGFADDLRDYGAAAGMLHLLGVHSVNLYTNNPDKIRQLEENGVRVAERVPHEMEGGAHNHAYLRTKAERSGHMLTLRRKKDS